MSEFTDFWNPKTNSGIKLCFKRKSIKKRGPKVVKNRVLKRTALKLKFHSKIVN